MADGKRALRLHHGRRLKARVRRMSFFQFTGIEPSPRQRGLWANTRKPCSCYLCGNARRFYGETIQEARASQRERWE